MECEDGGIEFLLPAGEDEGSDTPKWEYSLLSSEAFRYFRNRISFVKFV